MKKILFSLALALSVLCVQAQNSWEIQENRNKSVYLNANLSHMNLDLPTLNPVGMSVGVDKTIQLGKAGFFTQVGAELGYQQARADYVNSKLPYRLTYKTLSARVPLNVGYKFPVGVAENMALSLYAGANVQYYMYTQENWNNYTEQKESNCHALNNKLHYGLQLGGNFHFNAEWYAGAEFSYNLSRICKEAGGDEFPPTAGPATALLNMNPRPYTVTLRIGHKF